MKEMKEIKTWSLAFTYVGCFLGAGFISGQELWQFFGSFGNLGYVGFCWQWCCSPPLVSCSCG